MAPKSLIPLEQEGITMFGQNEIVGQQFFKNASDKLLVTSRFRTLQGEGPYAGLPAFFIRFAKCNLACSFCDTYFDSGTWFTISELVNEIETEIRKSFNGNVPHWAQLNPKRRMVLVITGGEPSLQKNLLPLLSVMDQLFYHTQIESNGIVFPLIPASTTLVCSPKCIEKGGKAIRYHHPNSDTLRRADCLKFVICDDPDSPYSAVPQWALAWQEQTGKEIFISPMNVYRREPQKARELRAARQGQEISLEERSTTDEVISFWEPGLLDLEANKRNHEYTAKYAINNGLRMGVQLHLLASVA